MAKTLLALVLAFIIPASAYCILRDLAPPPAYSDCPRKLASLSPAITETLYAIGLGDRIAGVTRFCNYPPDARHKPKVGGFREINLEAIARLQPDLVILPGDMAHFKHSIEQMGIAVFLFEGNTLDNYLDSTAKLGRLCEAKTAAANLISSFAPRAASAPRHRPTVIFGLLNPENCQDAPGQLTIIGDDGFYNELIKAAGGKNAYEGGIPYPQLSREALLRLNPDIIVLDGHDCQDMELTRQMWQNLDSLKAVRDGNLILFTDPGATIPGPRSSQTYARLAGIIAGAKP